MQIDDGLEFSFRGEVIRIGPAMLKKYPHLEFCKKLDEPGRCPSWMDPTSLKLFFKLIAFGSKFKNSEEIEGKTKKILKLLWYSDYFAAEKMQKLLLIDLILGDLHVLNAASYLHEGLKKISSTKSISNTIII